MTQKRRPLRRRASRRPSIDLANLSISKGRRAKRGRRVDYKDVFLHCGITNVREAEAGEALLTLNKEKEAEKYLESRPADMPSKLSGLREQAEKLIAYIGTSDSAPVEFCIPQVADALDTDITTLVFLLNVLVAFDIVNRTKSGNYVWKGRESVWDRLDNVRADSHQHAVYESENSLPSFCSCLLDVLRDCKAVVCLEAVGMEIETRLSNCDPLRLWHQLHCVNAVLVAAGIVQELHNGAERRYVIRSPTQETSITTEPSTDSAIPSTQAPAQQPDAWQYIRQQQEESPRISTTKPSRYNKSSVLKTVLDTVLRQASSMDASVSPGPGFVIPDGSLPSSRAAVMEIVGGDINHVGVFDVLGPATMACPRVSDVSRSNPMIALALPQWMFMRHPCTQPPPTAQIYAINPSVFNTHGSTRLPHGIENDQQQHLHLTHAPVLQTTSPGFLNKVAAIQRNPYPQEQRIHQGQPKQPYATSQFKHV